jgi:hypothetical protein
MFMIEFVIHKDGCYLFEAQWNIKHKKGKKGFSKRFLVHELNSVFVYKNSMFTLLRTLLVFHIE